MSTPSLPPQPGPTSKRSFDLPARSRREQDRAKRILARLYEKYPDVRCELDFTNAHELLVATILSAQATDVGVNKATPGLFAAFPTPADYAAASPAAIEPHVRTIGLFRNKARAIHAAMTTVCEQHGGEIPRTMDELLELRGVARKTANVVLGNAFGINVGVVVDTHVQRLAQRFDLSHETDPKKIERDLMALVPRPHWTNASHLLIWHGRRVCKARGNTCREDDLCRTYCSEARG